MIRPKRSLPPEEFCLGTSPSQAASCRLEWKAEPSPRSETSATVQQNLAETARNLRQQIGRNILHLRRDWRVTLKQLSRRTGLGTHLLDHFELGISEIELRHLFLVAQVLKADWRDLLEDEVEGEERTYAGGPRFPAPLRSF